MFYSASTGGFYGCDHCNKPDDCVEITPERHQELVAGNHQGLSILPDENGLPQLVDQTAPSPEQMESEITGRLRAYVDEATFKHLECSDMGESEKAQECLDYRMELWAVRQQDEWPDSTKVSWPQRPWEQW